jgi:hypothetical protein
MRHVVVLIILSDETAAAILAQFGILYPKTTMSLGYSSA